MRVEGEDVRLRRVRGGESARVTDNTRVRVGAADCGGDDLRFVCDARRRRRSD